MGKVCGDSPACQPSSCVLARAVDSAPVARRAALVGVGRPSDAAGAFEVGRRAAKAPRAMDTMVPLVRPPSVLTPDPGECGYPPGSVQSENAGYRRGQSAAQQCEMFGCARFPVAPQSP